MKKVSVILLAVFLCLCTSAATAGDPVEKSMDEALETFATGCEQELNTFCKDVTPGEGRILACLYAFGDKVSTRCEYALYDSVHQLNRTLATLSFVVGECREDLEGYCADVQPGQGRLLDCLNRNESKVSKRCNMALKDAGWK